MLKQICIWLLWEPRFVYMIAAAALSPILISFWRPDENTIRYAGLVLQLLGIGTVAWGIRKTRKLFKQPSLWSQARQRFRQWSRDRPTYRRSVAVGAGTGSLSVSGGRARFSVWNDAGPNATPEQRIEALERNLTRIRTELASLEDKTDHTIEKQSEALKREEDLRARADQEIQDLVTATGTGGLYISMAGVMFLLWGVVMSAIPHDHEPHTCGGR